ncbi:MAG: hypothetical protein ABIN97_09065 [Ginsengibacter sp.]
MSTEANEIATTITTCFSCGNNISHDDVYCTNCGYPLQGTIEERDQFMNNRNYKHMELHEMNRKIKSGTTTMYVLAGFCVIGGVIFYAVTSELENPMAVLIMYLVLAAIYVGLALWSKKQPLPAIVSGLILYIIVQLLAMIEDPMNIVKGIIFKIIIIVYLIKAVRSASDAQRIKKELNL